MTQRAMFCSFNVIKQNGNKFRSLTSVEVIALKSCSYEEMISQLLFLFIRFFTIVNVN